MEGNCWDFFKCPDRDMSQCPAFVQKQGGRCWLVASTSADIVNSGVTVSSGVKHCFNCDFFISQHEIS